LDFFGTSSLSLISIRSNKDITGFRIFDSCFAGTESSLSSYSRANPLWKCRNLQFQGPKLLAVVLIVKKLALKTGGEFA
jgi:hypothetical protein